MQQIPLVGGLVLGDQWQTYLAGSKLHLFASGYVPGPGDTLADLQAVECTYSGYSSNGVTLTAWLAGVYDPQGGVSISSPQVQFAYVAPGSGSGTTNNVGGWFLEDSAGNLIADGTFLTPVLMGVNGDGFPITLYLFIATTNLVVSCSLYGQQQP